MRICSVKLCLDTDVESRNRAYSVRSLAETDQGIKNILKQFVKRRSSFPAQAPVLEYLKEIRRLEGALRKR
jgi:hypothetical protein